MQLDSRYRVNLPNIVADTIDGEVVVIHLQAGAYYSMTDTAAIVWSLLEGGHTIQDVIERLAGVYTGGTLTISLALAPFVAQLEEQGLIVPANGANGSNGNGEHEARPLTLDVPSGTAFSAPKLEVYRDMQNLLMIDPIHDVGDEGWPHQP